MLLISVDGLHQSDLAWYVAKHPKSALSSLVSEGTSYTNAQTPFPSDSYLGMVAQVTAGNPSSTGIYYDDSCNQALLPPGTTSCAGVAPGTEVTYFEALDDDGWLMWTNDRSAAATTFAKNFLLANNGMGNDIQGNPKPYTHSGLTTVYAGAAAAAFMGVPAGDPRAPDLIGIAQIGSVYTGKKAKIAEHGGDHTADRDVALVASGGAVAEGKVMTGSVETTQIAPTILQLLGLNPKALKSVQTECTKVPPGI